MKTSNKEPAKKVAKKEDSHEPAPSQCDLVQKMNKMNPDVKQQYEKLGAFLQTNGPQMDSSLPVLGPYKYQNAATYKG